MSPIHRSIRHEVFALAAAASLLVGCRAIGSTEALPDRSGAPRPSPVPEWVSEPPAGCALGCSGPTLHPADAIVNAQEDARDALAGVTLGVRLRTVLAETSGGPREVTLQEVRGFLEGARIVSIWYDAAGRAPAGRPGVMVALACLNRAGSGDTRVSGVPSWIYNVPRTGGRLCALGLSGPTLGPGDREANAETDALDRLAEALAVRVDRVLLDVDREETTLVSLPEVEPWAKEAARTKGTVEAGWTDETGIGPLARPGVRYALACIDLEGNPYALPLPETKK